MFQENKYYKFYIFIALTCAIVPRDGCQSTVFTDCCTRIKKNMFQFTWFVH